MKKMMSLSLAALLAFSAVPAAFAQTTSTGVKVGTSTKVEVNVNKTTSSKSATSQKASVQQAVQLKKELIELRQQLKAAKEANAELKAKYEFLVSELEKQSALQQALEVQLELLQRFYKPGDKETFEKLGELYEKKGDNTVKAFVNGKQPVFDVPPFIEKGRTLVPIRAISSALKADVKWDAATRTIVITRGDVTIILYLDKAVALVNGKTVKLDAKPIVKKGRTFLPLRFVSEQLKAKVTWQVKGKIVIIEDNATDSTNTGSNTTTGTTTTTNTDTNNTTGTTTTTNTDTNNTTGTTTTTNTDTNNTTGTTTTTNTDTNTTTGTTTTTSTDTSASTN